MLNNHTIKNSYSFVTSIIVIAIVFMLNLMVRELAGNSLEFDISGNGIYEVSEISMGLLDDLDTQVEFKVIAKKESVDDMIVNFIDKYTSISDKVTLTWIDPILYPSALEEYNTTEYSVVISCGETGKNEVIPISDILYFDEISYYYYGTYIYEFDGDGLFTSAINRVTKPQEYLLYTVSGHGESTFSNTVSTLLDRSNINTQDLNLLTSSNIPENCDLLTMVAPQSDITAEESQLLCGYLDVGGKILVMLEMSLDSMPNLESLLSEYGLELVDGYVVDMQRAYQGNAYYIIPSLSLTGSLGADIKTDSVLVINTRGFLEVSPKRDTIAVDSFMNTSEYGVAVTQDSEVEGIYSLGAVATETVIVDGEEREGKLTVYGSANIIDAEITDRFTSLENTTLFMNSIMANFDDAINVAIEPRVIEDSFNVVENPRLYSSLFVIIIPLAILALGFIVWNVRRKK